MIVFCYDTTKATKTAKQLDPKLEAHPEVNLSKIGEQTPIAFFFNWVFSQKQLDTLSNKYNGKEGDELIAAIESDLNCSIYDETYSLKQALQEEGLNLVDHDPT